MKWKRPSVNSGVDPDGHKREVANEINAVINTETAILLGFQIGHKQ
jgi:hypothetical protein